MEESAAGIGLKYRRMEVTFSELWLCFLMVCDVLGGEQTASPISSLEYSSPAIRGDGGFGERRDSVVGYPQLSWSGDSGDSFMTGDSC